MTNLLDTDLTAKTAVELRKIGSAAGVKGAAKGKKADLLAALLPIQDAQRAERDAKIAASTPAPSASAERKLAEAAGLVKPVAAPTTKNLCTICGVRRGMSAATRRQQGLAKDFSDLCLPCYDEAGWENTHSDAGHEGMDLGALTEEQAAEVHGCWICYPELNEAKKAPRTGRSRAGMVIIAKGTEIHKSETFRVAAEAAGWTVEMMRETYEMEADAEGEGTRYYATATRGTDSISLAWDGRAYDYPASSAVLAGKGRKVRNLKEALRLI